MPLQGAPLFAAFLRQFQCPHDVECLLTGHVDGGAAQNGIADIFVVTPVVARLCANRLDRNLTILFRVERTPLLFRLSSPGIVLRDFADIKEGDVLETYATRQVEREL